jgi:hypothetical protein
VSDRTETNEHRSPILRPECAPCRGTGYEGGLVERYSVADGRLIRGGKCTVCDATGLARAWELAVNG